MITQKEWVDDCVLRYSEETPTGYHFEEAHYPLSRKLGGKTTLSLWYPDHIVQGCLQTLEHQYPCIDVRKRKKEREIVEQVYPEHLETYDKAYNFSQKFAASAGGRASASREDLPERMKKVRSFRDEKEHREWGKTLGSRNVENGHLARISHLGASKGGVSASKVRMKCLVTGHISNPGGLTNYQKARGIDTSLRERVE